MRGKLRPATVFALVVSGFAVFWVAFDLRVMSPYVLFIGVEQYAVVIVGWATLAVVAIRSDLRHPNA